MSTLDPVLQALAVSSLVGQGQALEQTPAQAATSIAQLAATQGLTLDSTQTAGLTRLCRQLVRECNALHSDALAAGLPASRALPVMQAIMDGRLDLASVQSWSLWSDPDLRASLRTYFGDNLSLSNADLATGSLDLISGWTASDVPTITVPSAGEIFAARQDRYARIGALGDIAFTVSNNDVFTLQNLQRRREAAYAEHAVLGGRPLLEAMGLGLWEITLTIALLRAWCDPEARIAALVALQESQEHQGLAVGGRPFGRFVLMSLDEQDKRLGGAGEILAAEVRLTLREYWIPQGTAVSVARIRPATSAPVRSTPPAKTSTSDWSGLRSDGLH